MREEDRTAGHTRRQVTRIGAWAVPVVLVSAAVPLAAATGTGQVTIELGNQIFAEEIGEQVALVFVIEQSGAGVSGGASATLLGASGIAAWLDDDGEPDEGTDVALGLAEDGFLVVPVAVLGHGAFVVNVAFGSTMTQFTVVFESP